MKIIKFDLNNVPTNCEEIALCLGYFDGVHLGHQEIVKSAKESGLKTAVLTMDASPSHFLGNKDIFEITPLKDKTEIFASLGVDILYVMHFEKETLDMTKDMFIDQVLRKINPKMIFCGTDYTFGKFGSGTPNYLKNYFDVHVIYLLENGEEKVSSTAIRKLIKEGKTLEASSLLGRNYYIEGKVIEGKKIGRKIGLPTANVKPNDNYIIPLEGVYAGYVIFDDRKLKAIISIGSNPTINNESNIKIEPHILDFDEDIYNKIIRVEFLNYIRGVFKFNNLEKLKTQITKDIEITKKVLQ